MPLEMQSVVCRSKDVLSAAVGTDVVLMNASCDNYFGLDDIGSDIWRRMEQPIAVAQLCAALASEYAGPRGAIERDAMALLEDLLENNLIEAVGAGA